LPKPADYYQLSTSFLPAFYQLSTSFLPAFYQLSTRILLRQATDIVEVIITSFLLGSQPVNQKNPPEKDPPEVPEYPQKIHQKKFNQKSTRNPFLPGSYQIPTSF